MTLCKMLLNRIGKTAKLKVNNTIFQMKYSRRELSS